MAVTVDVYSAGGSGTNGRFVNSSINAGGLVVGNFFNVSAGATFLQIWCAVGDVPSHFGTLSLTWDTGGTNQAMTLIGSLTNTNYNRYIACFGLVNPTPGSKNLMVRATTETGQNFWSVGQSLKGSITTSVAAATQGFNAANDPGSGGTAMSVASTVAIPTGDLAFSFFECEGGGSPPTDGGTLVDGLGAFIFEEQYSGAGAVITASATCSPADFWQAGIVGIKAPSSSVALGKTSPRIFRPGQGPTRGLATPRSTYIPATGVAAAAGTGAANAVGAALFSGVGATSGLGTVVAVGASLAAGVGTSAGVGTVTGVGQDIASSVGASSGVGTAGAAGQGIANSVGASSGVGTVAGASSFTMTNVAGLWPASIFRPGQGPTYGLTTPRSNFIAPTGASAGASIVMAVGQAVFNGVGASSGVGTVAAVGQGIAASVGASSGVGTAGAVGQGISNGVGASSGVGTAGAAGQGIGNGVGASSGVGTVAGVSSSTFTNVVGLWPASIFRPGQGPTYGLTTPRSTFIAPTGISAGTSIAVAVGQAVFNGVAATSGLGTAAAASQSTAVSAAIGSGLGTAAAVGQALVPAVATSAGIGIVAVVSTGGGAVRGFTPYNIFRPGQGPSMGLRTPYNTFMPPFGVGVSVGVGTALGVTQSLVASVATASGVSTVAAAGLGAAPLVGASSGVGSAAAIGQSIGSGVATSSGVGTAQAFTGVIGVASGISVVAGVGRSSANAVAAASGIGAAAGAGRALRNIVGASSGIGVATGVSGSSIGSVATASGTSAVAGVGVMAYGASTGMFILTGMDAPVIAGGAITLATGFFKLTGEDANFTGLPVLWVPQPIPFPGWTTETVSYILFTQDGLPIILKQNDTVLTVNQPISWVPNVPLIPDWVPENVSYMLLTQDGLPILLEQTDDPLSVRQPAKWVPTAKPTTAWTIVG